MGRPISEKCQECSKIDFIKPSAYSNDTIILELPKCYNGKSCQKKRSYYRNLEYYRDMQRRAHRYIKYSKKQCVLCNEKDNLEVHHVIPQSFKRIDTGMNVLTLCSKCHRMITSYYRMAGWS